MGSAWFTGGVVAAPRGRIQFDFTVDGIRYRRSIRRPPSEANLRRARERQYRAAPGSEHRDRLLALEAAAHRHISTESVVTGH
jgi:hypothetical protein